MLRKQHLTPEYAAIQPNMVVPTLVHNDLLHIESVDIIRYLDEAWPTNPLFPHEPQQFELCEKYVQLAKDLHRAVRYMSFKWSFGGMAKLNAQQLQRLRDLEIAGSPEQLASFYNEFSHDKISQELYKHHLKQLEAGFSELDCLFRKDQRQWIIGDEFSMADIIWSIKMLRIRDCGYPMEINYPALNDWFKRVTTRPGFI